MNTHDTQSGTGDHTTDVDRELHQAIHSYATSVQPTDRLPGIRARTADAPDRGRRPWLLAGGSALVAASVVAAAVALVPSDDPSDDPSGGPSGEAPIAATSRQVTVFALAAVGDRGRLYPSQVDTEQSGNAGVDAVRALLDAEPRGRTNVWASVPDSVDIASVTEANGRVVVDFSGPVDDPWPTSEPSWAFDPALFSQQLVYTVQTELDTDAPVAVTMDGDTTDTVLTHRVGSQPVEADPAALSPILIDTPVAGADVSSPVTVRGTSDTFEANVVWEVSRDGDVVEQGTTMGGTMFDRRPFRFTVELSPGMYTVRAFETSAEDGSLVAEDTRTFTVR